MSAELNPYRAPAPEAERGADPIDWVEARSVGYVDSRMLCHVLLGLLLVGCVECVVSLGIVFFGWGPTSNVELLGSRVFMTRVLLFVMGMARLAALLVGVLFIRRMHRNAIALGAVGMQQHILWRVLVPCVSAVTGFVALRELWAASAPEHKGENWRAPAPSRLVVLWGLAFLSGALRGMLPLAFDAGPLVMKALAVARNGVAISALLTCASLVLGLQARQLARARRVLSHERVAKLRARAERRAAKRARRDARRRMARDRSQDPA